MYHAQKPSTFQTIPKFYMPSNISGIYMLVMKKEEKLKLEQCYFIWAMCLNNRQRGTNLSSSLNIYCAIIWLNSPSSTGSIQVKIDMESWRVGQFHPINHKNRKVTAGLRSS